LSGWWWASAARGDEGTGKLEGESQEGMMQLEAIVGVVVVAALAVGRHSYGW
jgi:hypothetical protein